ncbi:MAG TPA: HAD-IB family hydrolase, partial [Chromatiales bacterium]|nr:HAD-IB family hydrolase [Chromatiales bacterium]
MAVAVFDLDNTLLAGDSDCEWGSFLAAQGFVDPARQEAENRRYYQDYLDGTLDIQAFLAFQLRPLAEHDLSVLHALRARFVDERIRPIVLPAARALLQRHRAQGDVVVIVTATNRFITAPIAELLGAEHLLATEPEMVDGRYTGRPQGVPCFQG